MRLLRGIALAAVSLFFGLLYLVLVCLTSCGHGRGNGARPREMADSRVLATARHIHICLRVAVLRDSSHFRGFRPAAAPTVTALGTLGSSARCSGSRPLSRSLRRRSRRLRGDTRRNASSVNTPPRLATCLTAHPTNRVVACRSVRHSIPRPLPHLPQGTFFFVVSALARVSPGAKRSRQRRAQCGVQIRRAALVGAPLRGARFPAANVSRFRPRHNLISPCLIFARLFRYNTLIPRGEW